MDKHTCPRCNQSIASHEQDEHNDWHFATDLQSSSSSGGNVAQMPPSQSAPEKKPQQSDIKQDVGGDGDQLPAYAPPSYPPPTSRASGTVSRRHTNKVIEAAELRARDEVRLLSNKFIHDMKANSYKQEMQNALQTLQFQYRIYNSEIEPEHDTDYYCNCAIHKYQQMKRSRGNVLRAWSEAVMYPGEKSYNDFYTTQGGSLFNNNPYSVRIVSPYGYNYTAWVGQRRPQPDYHAKSIHQTIQLNNSLNREAQAKIDAQEPGLSIWDDSTLDSAISQLKIAPANDEKKSAKHRDEKHPQGEYPQEKYPQEKRQSIASASTSGTAAGPGKASKISGFRKALGIKSSEERAVSKVEKMVNKGLELRNAILAEEAGRWPDDQTRNIVAVYQEKVGMASKIADLRVRHPLQYIHLLRAGYFEPIPVAWGNQASNPLKFSIEAAAGWRGITPAWRGYEDTAEERLYWVLNHREGTAGVRMKPDFISEMNMARDRMATAVDPPPEYFAADDTCHVQHTSEGYSKQVMPAPFKAYDRPEVSTDDTMLLLDVSGSMDFDPVRPK